MTEFIKLTDMWHDGLYLEVGEVIFNEDWSNARLAEFCAYFSKYMGTKQLDLLYKFLDSGGLAVA